MSLPALRSSLTAVSAKKRGDNAFGATHAQPLSRVSTLSIGFREAKVKTRGEGRVTRPEMKP
jgi:hypothetical protein